MSTEMMTEHNLMLILNVLWALLAFCCLCLYLREKAQSHRLHNACRRWELTCNRMMNVRRDPPPRPYHMDPIDPADWWKETE